MVYLPISFFFKGLDLKVKNGKKKKKEKLKAKMAKF